MKTYEAVFNEVESEGVFGISLVNKPAMEGMFVALNEHTELQLKTVNKEQRILLGLVLEPNKPIYRNQNGEEFNIVFNEDTIKNLSYHFFKTNSQKNSTIEHVDRIEGVTFVESWLVEDSKQDKSALYGFNYPKGSWVATMKIDNDDIWNNFVKTGKVQGFSVDAMLGLKEINLKTEINMSSKILDMLRKIDVRLGGSEPTKEAEIKLGMVKTADGALTFEYEGEELIAGVRIFAIGEEEERVPLPEGEYPLEGDMVVMVDAEGVVVDVKSATVEEEQAPAEMNNEPTIDATNPLKDLAEIKSIMIKYQEENKAYQLSTQKEIEALKSKLVEFSEQPAAKPIKAQPQQIELNAKGKILEKLRNK
jgi:hypothetical protein